MAVDIPFMEVTGRKDVQNGDDDHGFWALFVTFESQNLLFLLFTSNLSYFNSFKLPYKIRLLSFCSPLTFQIPMFAKKYEQVNDKEVVLGND